jgi:hypothetical protein
MTETGLIATILSFIVSIVLGILNYVNLRKQAKSEEVKENSTATSNLVDSALKINKQELETIREINEDLKCSIKEKDALIEKLEERIKQLEEGTNG